MPTSGENPGDHFPGGALAAYARRGPGLSIASQFTTIWQHEGRIETTTTHRAPRRFPHAPYILFDDLAAIVNRPLWQSVQGIRQGRIPEVPSTGAVLTLPLPEQDNAGTFKPRFAPGMGPATRIMRLSIPRQDASWTADAPFFAEFTAHPAPPPWIATKNTGSCTARYRVSTHEIQETPD